MRVALFMQHHGFSLGVGKSEIAVGFGGDRRYDMASTRAGFDVML